MCLGCAFLILLRLALLGSFIKRGLLLIRKLIEQDMIINQPGLRGMTGFLGFLSIGLGFIISGVCGGTGWGRDME